MPFSEAWVANNDLFPTLASYNMGKLITVRRMSLLKVTVPHPMFRMWSRFVVIRRHLPPPPVAVPQTHPRAPHADHAQNCIRYRTAATPPPSAPCHSRAAALRGGASGAASAPAAAATLLLRALHAARSGLHPASAERIRSRSGDLSKAQDAHRARGAVAAHALLAPAASPQRAVPAAAAATPTAPSDTPSPSTAPSSVVFGDA